MEEGNDQGTLLDMELDWGWGVWKTFSLDMAVFRGGGTWGLGEVPMHQLVHNNLVMTDQY